MSKYYIRPVVPEDRTDPDSRIIINNIPVGITEQMLRRQLMQYGDAHIHVFIPGCQYTKGWAWTSFEEKEKTQRLLELAAQKNQSNISKNATDDLQLLKKDQNSFISNSCKSIKIESISSKAKNLSSSEGIDASTTFEDSNEEEENSGDTMSRSD